MAKNKRRRQLEQAILIPLDWVEERSGLVGYTKWFLFRKVPHDISWSQTLGSAALTAFIVQAVTGVVLAMYYKPDPDRAYESILHITNDVTLGWLVRGMHKWGASVFIILIFFHMGRVFLFGAYKYPRELNWVDRRPDRPDRPAHGLHRLPAALGPDLVLGDGRRHQPERDRAVPRPVHRAVPPGRGRDQPRHAVAVLLAAHAPASRRPDRADHAPHLPRHQARRRLAAVVADPARPRARAALSRGAAPA